MSFVKFAFAGVVASVLAVAPAAAAVNLNTYAQFFQKTNVKDLEFASFADHSTISVAGTSSLLIGLAYLKPGYSVGDLFDTTFSMTATSFDPVTATGAQFEQTGFSGQFSFTDGSLNVLTLDFSGGIFNLSFGTTPTAALIAECPCGITWSSDVFELPLGPKDFSIAINAILGDSWNEALARSTTDYYGENFRANVAGTFAAVPEPESWALMIAGFGLVGFAARRRRNATQRVTG